MVTHDLDTLFALSTRIAVLAEKHVIAVGPQRRAARGASLHQTILPRRRGQRALEVLDERYARKGIGKLTWKTDRMP
jgi:phospholipid/cholesterol/gamma-HCH transport system ATP-binding protein